MCKDFEGVDMVDNAEVLYSSLLRYCPKWPKKIAGKILEQVRFLIKFHGRYYQLLLFFIDIMLS